MTGMDVPAVPAWVVVSPVQVDDLYWLAYSMYESRAAPGLVGIGGAVVWVWSGDGPAPVTGRTDAPVTRGLARAEMWAAIAAYGSDDPPAPRPGALCDVFGVPYLPPLKVDRILASGVLQTLAWMLGEKGQDPPLMLPFRDAAGRPLTVGQLFTRLIRVAPGRYERPEQRRELERLGLQSQETADLIADTKHRVVAARAAG
jgi:hypothetical protein